MKIGIDARMFGPNVGGGGLGRYVEQLVTELQAIDGTDRFILFLKRENFDACEITNARFEKRLADFHWYGAAEQLRFPELIAKEKLDLMHFPHWNVPVTSRTPFVVTLHDLILLEEPRSARATTRSSLVFGLKRLGYKFVLNQALGRAKKIIAVSQYTKESIYKFFPALNPSKIVVAHEGIVKMSAQAQPGARGPILVYVGNAYPHKNLDRLLDAFALVRTKHPNLELVLAGREDVFYKRLMDEARRTGRDTNVHYIASPSDLQIASLLQTARAFVFPSRTEGFGLPPLEAMQAGIPVASSTGGSLPEVLGDAAKYFSPNNTQDMAGAIEQVVSDEHLRASLVARGYEQIKRYSWATHAQAVQNTYHSAL
jgi:glycosyltransferase involved in cell wall biosynthesis